MGSKAILFLCLSLAVVLMIASEVAARDLAETAKAVDENTKVVEDAKYPGGGYPGGGYGGYPGGGNGGRAGYGGRGGYGGYCRWGCCGRNYYGRGCRCCSYAGEAVDAEPQQTKP